VTRLANEIWRPIFGLKGRYEVSNLGRVKSVHPQRGPFIMRPGFTPNGYAGVHISRNPVVHWRVNRLVLTHFDRKPKPGEQAAHRNGKRSDNRLANLFWLTAQQNAFDKENHGTLFRGEKHPYSKLKAKDVLAIKARLNKGEAQCTIARDYPQVNRIAIWSIKHNKTWKHLLKSGEGK
jgi:hypothetical protein